MGSDIKIIRKIPNGKDSPDDIRNYHQKTWDILQLSYAKLDGFKTYKGYDSFVQKCKYAKVIFNDNENISAVSIYRCLEDFSYKMVGLGCNQTQEGKNNLQKIINSDIQDKEINYWIEAAGNGPIEHWFDKYGGIPIPNDLVIKILKDVVTDTSTIKLLDDGFHYIRTIGANKDKEDTKIIFGIRNKEIYDELLKKSG